MLSQGQKCLITTLGRACGWRSTNADALSYFASAAAYSSATAHMSTPSQMAMIHARLGTAAHVAAQAQQVQPPCQLPNTPPLHPTHITHRVSSMHPAIQRSSHAVNPQRAPHTGRSPHGCTCAIVHKHLQLQTYNTCMQSCNRCAHSSSIHSRCMEQHLPRTRTPACSAAGSRMHHQMLSYHQTWWQPPLISPVAN